jgi:2-dehydropantoate 2-reductase
MKTLIVGAGALGGIIGARLLAAGASVSLATRSAAAAEEIKASGLRITGIGGDLCTAAGEVASLAEYSVPGIFDVIVLATKAQDAIDVAPSLVRLLAPGGTLLPIQNGGVPQMLASRLGERYVLGGLSNRTATMLRPGVYKRTNAGYVLIGELGGGQSDRSERVRQWLSRAVNVKVTPNLQGAVWSKLLLNCSITTIGAIAGLTMRAYIDRPEGRELFGRTYDEALSVALASGVRPEKMLVDPIPPGWNGRSISGEAYNLWLVDILNGYGDAKASMLQNFERGRTTEIDFINGYVVDTARQFSVNTPVNIAIIETVHAITRGQIAPDPSHLSQILKNSVDTGETSVAFPLSNKGEQQ